MLRLDVASLLVLTGILLPIGSVDIEQSRYICVPPASRQPRQVGTPVADWKPGEEPEILPGMGDMEGKHRG